MSVDGRLACIRIRQDEGSACSPIRCLAACLFRQASLDHSGKKRRAHSKGLRAADHRRHAEFRAAPLDGIVGRHQAVEQPHWTPACRPAHDGRVDIGAERADTGAHERCSRHRQKSGWFVTKRPRGADLAARPSRWRRRTRRTQVAQARRTTSTAARIAGAAFHGMEPPNVWTLASDQHLSDTPRRVERRRPDAVRRRAALLRPPHPPPRSSVVAGGGRWISATKATARDHAHDLGAPASNGRPAASAPAPPCRSRWTWATWRRRLGPARLVELGRLSRGCVESNACEMRDLAARPPRCRPAPRSGGRRSRGAADRKIE